MFFYALGTNTGATHIYIDPSVPYIDADLAAKKITVGTYNDQLACSCATESLPVPQVGHNFPTEGYIILSFFNTLVGIGRICDAGCYVTFSKHDVTFCNPRGRPILTVCRDHKITPNIWRFALQPHPTYIPTPHAATETASLTAFSAYDLPSVGALVRYLHAIVGLPIKPTWLKAIKAEWYATWPGLTYSNASKYCPESAENIKGHMTQSQQGV